MEKKGVNYKRVVIVGNDYFAHLKELFIKIFNELEIQATTSSHIIEHNHDDLFFVIAPQSYGLIPPNRVVLQLEQFPNTKYFNDTNNKMLLNSVNIFDYSVANCENMNMTYKGHIHHLPLSPYILEVDINNNIKENDFIFYGKMNNKREKILELLSKNYKIDVIDNMIGEKLHERISRSKYCINIHYYDCAIFEAVRYVECLNLGTPMISETSVDMKNYDTSYNTLKFIEMDDPDTVIGGLDALLIDQSTYDVNQNNIDMYSRTKTIVKKHFKQYFI